MQNSSTAAKLHRAARTPRRRGLFAPPFFALLMMLMGLVTLLGPALRWQNKTLAMSTPPAAAPELRSVLHNGPLRVSMQNPRYFADGNGKIVVLAGAHAWMNFQDTNNRSNGTFQFPYDQYLSSLSREGLNFFRLWAWEQTLTDNANYADYYHAPVMYQRTGPGTALDGRPKMDLTKWNQAYFDRMRARIIAAGEQGIYVSVMLFDGWSVVNKDGVTNPWPGHPYNPANNINGVDADTNNNNSGEEVHTVGSPVWDEQIAYVHKVIDTVNDLDNVLYEISNESGDNSVAWQYAMINEIHAYEAQKGKVHPVGMTAIYPGGQNSDLFNSPAEWISPNGDVNNPLLGDGKKVIVNDTDHLCGVCGDRRFAWKSFLNGLNPILMDQYGWDWYGEDPNYTDVDPPWLDVRRNLGWGLMYSKRLNLATAVPHPELSSSGYALASPNGPNAMYLVYVETGRDVRVDLRGTSGTLRVEWLDTITGARRAGAPVQGGSQDTLLRSPFAEQSVVFLFHQSSLYLPGTTR